MGAGGDPIVEHHYKGHKDAVRCVNFNPNLKQVDRLFLQADFYDYLANANSSFDFDSSNVTFDI